MKLGIDKIKEVLKSGFTIGMAVVGAMEDKKINLKDLPHCITIATQLPKIVKNKDEFIAQAKDLDAEEKIELQQYCKDEFDIPNDETELFIEDCFDWCIRGYDWVMDGKKLFLRGKELAG